MSYRVRRLGYSLRFLAPCLLIGCSSAVVTSGRDIARTTFVAPPFIAGSMVTVAPGALLVLPVAWQPEGPGGTTRLSQAPDAPLALLLQDVQHALDAAVARNALGPKGGEIAGTGIKAPDVYSGCPAQLDAVCFDDAYRRSMGEQQARHQLDVRAASKAWRNALATQLAATGASHALLITVEVGTFLPHPERNGSPSIIRLGRDRDVTVPSRGESDAPTAVLQLTGVLVDRNGRALRAAAEGLLAKANGIRAGLLGATEQITDTDVTLLRNDGGRSSVHPSPALSHAMELLLRDLGVAR